MRRIFLSLLFICLPVAAYASEGSADTLPSMQRVQLGTIQMAIPSGWREITHGNYTLYTPLSQWNPLDYITGIHFSQNPISSDYSTLSAAARSLENANPNIRILSTKDTVKRGSISGFDIEFITDCECENSHIHQLWRFWIGKDSIYVVGLNGTEKTYQRFKPLFRRVVRTVRIRE